MNRPALVVLLTALLAGCAGPAVETATVEPVVAPAQWRVDAGPQAALAQDWWRTFGDPQLATLVEAALSRNLDIAVATARIREAKAQEQTARAALLPTLDAAASVADSRSINAFGEAVEQTTGQPALQAAWEADLFGRLSDQRAAARDAWLASGAARDALRLSVAGATASGYVTLRALDARLAVARETLAARSEALRLSKRRADTGYSPRLELAQAEAEYQGAAQLIPPIEQAIARQENALKLLTGELPGPVERGADLLAITRPPVPDGLPSDLLRRRPDVAQAEYQLAASDKSLAAARKRFLPQLRFNASAGAAFSTLLPDPLTVWSVGGSVLAPIFEAGRLRAGAEAAGAQRDQAAYAYRRTALTAFREVNDAMAGVVSADAQVVALTRQRDALVDTLRMATNRYRAGYSAYLEQLDAQRGLLSSELALVQARADALTGRIALYQAMGGGWSGLEP